MPYMKKSKFGRFNKKYDQEKPAAPAERAPEEKAPDPPQYPIIGTLRQQQSQETRHDMTLREYQSFASRYIKSAYDGGDFKRQQELAVLAVVSKVGEMCALLREHKPGEPTSKEVGKKVGEAFFFCAELMTLHGMDIREVVLAHLDGLSESRPDLFGDFTKTGYTAEDEDGQAGS